MAKGHIELTVEGIAELDAGFNDFVAQLARELQPGFMPEARYRGEMGEPFTLEKIDLVARQTGFMVTNG